MKGGQAAAGFRRSYDLVINDYGLHELLRAMNHAMPDALDLGDVRKYSMLGMCKVFLEEKNCTLMIGNIRLNIASPAIIRFHVDG